MFTGIDVMIRFIQETKKVESTTGFLDRVISYITEHATVDRIVLSVILIACGCLLIQRARTLADRAAEAYIPTLICGTVAVVGACVVYIGNAKESAYVSLLVVASLIPAFLIINQALFVVVDRLRWNKQSVSGAADTKALKDIDTTIPAKAMGGKGEVIIQYYSCALAIIAVICVVGFLVGIDRLNCVKSEANKDVIPGIARGGFLGLLGAYMYVLFTFGYRSVRKDLTLGIILWSSGLLVVGTILGGVIYYVFVDGDGKGHTLDGACFIAGYSPKFAIEWLETAAKKLFAPKSDGFATAPVVPMRAIGGITEQIEERLSEERIASVTSLAYADPFKLMRHTNFSRRQIVNWIDEAILIITLPDGWQGLRKCGITGAIDLAWGYVVTTDANDRAAQREKQRKYLEEVAKTLNAQDSGKLQIVEQELASAREADEETKKARIQQEAYIKKLADAANIKDPEILESVMRRLSEDAQVKLIWYLYQSNDDAITGTRMTQANDSESASTQAPQRQE